MTADMQRPVVPTGLLEETPVVTGFSLEDFLTFRLLVLARAFDRQAKRTYGESFGLSLIEWRIMAMIGSKGDATVNRLASWMDYDKAQISRAVAALVESGHLKRVRNVQDTRSAILTLSPQGRALHSELMAFGRERQRHLLAVLTPDQRRALYEVMAVLDSHLRGQETTVGNAGSHVSEPA